MKQTRGALKFLLAEYRAVLKNAMLSMAVATLALASTSANAEQSIYIGKILVNGSEKTISDITSTNKVEIGSAGDTVVISNEGKAIGIDASGIGIKTPNTNGSSVTVNGKNITITSDFRPIYSCKGSNGYKHAVSIGSYDNTDTLTISQTKDVGENGIAVLLRDSNGTLDLAAKTINISSQGWYAVHAQHNNEDHPETLPTEVTLKADTINITNTNERGAGLSAYSGAFLKVDGDLTVTAARAIEARGNATIKINTDGTHKTVLNGDIVFGTDNGTQAGSGRIINATLDLNLSGSDSSWTGNLSTYYPNNYSDEEKKAGKDVVKNATITLADGAQWNVTKVQDSSGDKQNVLSSSLALNNLVFNDATINIQDTETTVNVDSLKGNGGTVNVATTVTENGTSVETAKLVAKTANVSNSLSVNLAGINSDSITDADAVMQKAANAVTVSDTNSSLKQTITVEEGDINGKITATTDGKGTPTSVTQKENSKLAALGSVTAMNFMQWRHDMNDLNKRMGELRDSATGVGVWARAYGSEHKYGSQNVTAKNKSIQIGSDTDVGAGWKVGGAFTYTDGDATYTNGKADNKAYGFALYGSWFADNGLFVDLIGKYSHLSSDYELGNMKGGLHNTALSLSAEVGWNIPFADIAFIEPQAELSYGIIYGDTDHTSNGVYLKQDDMKTLIGRTGFRTGLHFNENKGTVYARASVLHDFQGETKFYASNNVTSTVKSDDLGGTYYEFGLGANYKFTPNCYSYVDLERQTHGPIAEKWRWNVGMRYVF